MLFCLPLEEYLHRNINQEKSTSFVIRMCHMCSNCIYGCNANKWFWWQELTAMTGVTEMYHMHIGARSYRLKWWLIHDELEFSCFLAFYIFLVFSERYIRHPLFIMFIPPYVMLLRCNSFEHRYILAFGLVFAFGLVYRDKSVNNFYIHSLIQLYGPIVHIRSLR